MPALHGLKMCPRDRIRSISERDLAQVSMGQTAAVTLKAYPHGPIEATVVRIVPQAEGSVGDESTFPVVLMLGDSDLGIHPGMTGRAEIRGEE